MRPEKWTSPAKDIVNCPGGSDVVRAADGADRLAELPTVG